MQNTAEVEEGLLNLAWLSRSLTSRLAKEFLPKLSVVACKPTRVAIMGPSQVVTETKMSVLHAFDGVAMKNDETGAEMMIVTTDLQLTLAHQPCLRSLPLRCLLDSNSLLYPMECLSFLLQDSQIFLLRRKHNNLLHQDIELEDLSFSDRGILQQLDCARAFIPSVNHGFCLDCTAALPYPIPSISAINNRFVYPGVLTL
jgi:hypothetical protein